MKGFRELALLGGFMVWNGATDTSMAQWVSLGPEGGGITALTIDPQTPSTIYATGDGIFKSVNGGTSWSSVNNGLTGHDVQGLVIDPQTSTTLYAGGVTGVFKSTNGGESWIAISNGLAGNYICTLAIDSQTPSTIYAGTWVNGVYKSVNGGTSWSSVNNGLIAARQVFALAIDPQTPTTLYAGIFGGGVFKSINGGGDWTSVGTVGGIVYALAIDPQTPATLYAGTWGGGVFKSSDGGGSWTAINSGLTSSYVRAMAIDPQRPATIYAGTDESRVFKSNDGGGSWTAINTAWMGGDVRTLAIDPQNPSRIYAGTPEGGAFVNSLADCSNSISPLNQSYSSSGIASDRVDVTVTGDCGWTAVSHDSWITITSGSSGAANGEVTFSVAPNTSPASRTGTMTIAGETFTVNQAGLTSSFSIAGITPSSGPVTGGTTVTLHGGGFQVGASVTIGGVPARINALTSDQMTAVTGIATAPGSYDVVITNPGGQSMVLTKGFTYTPVSGPQTGEIFVPIVLSSIGVNGSFYSSELTLTNRGTGTATVHFTYTAAFGSGSGTGIDTLAPGRQKIVPDAISYLRSLGVPIPSTGNQGGTLQVTFSGLSSPSDGSVTVRTTTEVPEGRAGLAYAGIPTMTALAGPSYICGLRQNQADRSNVALQNVGSPSDGNITLRLTVFSGAKGPRISKLLPDQVLGPGGFAQINGVLTSNGLELSNGYVRVERIKGTAPYYAYGVINDQSNSDGSFIPPIPESALAGKTRMTLPVAVETGPFQNTGLDITHWSTELVITNWSSARKTLNCRYVADAIQAADHAASFTIDLEAGQQLIQPELVQWLRDTQVAGIGPIGPTYGGALFVSVANSDLSGISVAARTSAGGGGGEYGLFYTALAEGTTSQNEAWLYGLHQNWENRTNMALVNTGETDASLAIFQVDLYDGSTGQKVSSFMTAVEAAYWMQFNGVLAPFGVTEGYAHITRTAGVNPFIAYAVINDGDTPGHRSGDGAFIASSP